MKLWTRSRRKIYVLIAIIVCTYLYAFPIQVDVTSQEFLGQNRCPACYGENLCPSIFIGGFQLIDWRRFTISKFLNAKNVFKGKLNGELVIAKKLGHNDEIANLDVDICKMAHQPPKYCNAAHYVKFLAALFTKDNIPENPRRGSFYQTLKMSMLDEISSLAKAGNDYLGCVNHQSLMDFISFRPQFHRSQMSLENVITLLLINPEPLVLTTFPSEEGWPVPKFHGSCGRVALVEFVGNPLSNYLKEDFVLRARLGLQLLKIAEDFTSRHEELALYLTDWTFDNFAVDGYKKVKAVDLENVILVNRTHVKELKGPGWDVAHTSPKDGYFLGDLCAHEFSDNNLLGACQLLWPGGLLHGIPDAIKERHFLLEKLLKECTFPSHPRPGSRFEAVKQLKEILEQI